MFVFPSPEEGRAVDVDGNCPSICGISTWNDVKECILERNFPLHYACRDGNVGKVSVLLDAILKGSTTPEGESLPSLATEDPFYGWMAAHWAAYFGKLECLQLVVQASRHADVPSHRLLQTPLHMAAFAGHPYCLQWLLKYGSDPTRCDYKKETPLHKAARTGSVECMALLINAGAKLSWKNLEDKTPAQVAQESGHTEAAQYLQLQCKFHFSNDRFKTDIHLDNTISNGGYYGYQPTFSAKLEDVLLSPQVAHNVVLVGGRKRSREMPNLTYGEKRIRTEEVAVDPVNVPKVIHDKPIPITKCLLTYYI